MTITIYFDGGAKGNPGKMYGSYSISIDGTEIISPIEQYGHGTNNQAEFIALEKALERTIDIVTCRSLELKHVKLNLFTDSKILQRRIADPSYRPPNKYRFAEGAVRMNICANRCHRLLYPFKHYRIEWNSREVNVQKFGH